jgi:hypothetical protein
MIGKDSELAKPLSRAPLLKGKARAIDLLIKIACFVKRKDVFSVLKAATLK